MNIGIMGGSKKIHESMTSARSSHKNIHCFSPNLWKKIFNPEQEI